MVQKQKLIVTTSDGVALNVVKYVPEQSKGKIFMLHWLSVPKEGPSNILLDTALWLVNAWFKVITFDFRGHWGSGGESPDITVETGLLDIDAVFRSEEKDDLPFWIFGFSYGGMISIEYTVKNALSPHVMVFFSPALDFVDGVFKNEHSVMWNLYLDAERDGSLDRDGYFTLPYNWFRVGKKVFQSAKHYKPYEDLKTIVTKSLIIQWKNDQMLSYEYMKMLWEPIVDKYITLDTVHGLIEEKEKAIQETVSWFSSYVK